MAESDHRIDSIMKKLRDSTVLSIDELQLLHSRVDQIESLGRAASSHHDSHTSPNSHHSQHHTNVADIAGVLERMSQRKG